MDKEDFNNHSDIDFLNVNDLLLSYKKYMSDNQRELSTEDYDKLRELMTQDESEIIFGDDE